jgi:type IV secretory pathway TraG/TraD family ATPase VirD4
MADGPRKSRPVVFLCDEYQQIASSGDANFFDTSRALGVIGIVASQSVDAYLNALGNEHAAMTLLGNFANIVAFRSTPRTMQYLSDKLGQVEVWKVSHGGSLSNGEPGESLSTSQQRQQLLDPQLFRSLDPEFAVAMLTVGGMAFDDVVKVPQVTGDDLV